MMTARPLFAFIALLLCAQTAFAGAWPREKGGAFLALQLKQNPDTLHAPPVAALFAEYGLSDTFTLGGKVEYDQAIQDVTDLTLFTRWNMPAGDSGLQRAISLGAEGTVDDPSITSAFHLGYGFQTPLGAGWADVEIGASFPVDGDATEYGAFGLIGVKPYDSLMAMVGFDVSTDGTSTQKKAIPSVAWQIANGKHLTVEYTFDLEVEHNDEVAVGLWLEF